MAGFLTFVVPCTKDCTGRKSYFQLGITKHQLSKNFVGCKPFRNNPLQELCMTWPPRRTANLRTRQDSRVVSLPLKLQNSSLAAAELDYVQESQLVVETEKEADRKLILVSFPRISLKRNPLKVSPQLDYFQDAHLFTDMNFLLCSDEEKISDVSTMEWNVLNLFGLSPNANWKYKTSSWIEKLTVLIADIICDFLVLDTLWQLDSFSDFISFCAGGFVAFITADFISGIYNWASKNYFSNSDSCFVSLASKSRNGSKTKDFSLDDEEMSDFFSNVYWYCLFTIPFLVTLTYFRDHLPVFIDSFLIFFLSLLAIWPEAHKWGHMSDPERPPPPVVRLLQSYSLLIPIHEHLWHHDSHLFYRTGTEDPAWLLEDMHNASQTASYCAISGHWNRFLDATGFFRKLERLIYFLFRVEPRVWSKLPHLKGDLVDME